MGRLCSISTKNKSLISTLVELFPTYSKDRLFAFVLTGSVMVNEEVVKDHTREIKKDSIVVLFDSDITHSECDMIERTGHLETKHVSRGVDKLLPVLKRLDVGVSGRVWMDVGSAAGGFTQSLLELGAEYVHAIDVGYNLLDYTLRIDSRVILHERCNIRSLTELDPRADCAVVDLSFRSLRGVAGQVINMCEEKYLLALCKPQFEYAYQIRYHTRVHSQDTQATIDTPNEIDYAEFDGLLLDLQIVKDTILKLCIDLAHEDQVVVTNIIPAAIKGKKGNQEYFLEIVPLELQGSNNHTELNKGFEQLVERINV